VTSPRIALRDGAEQLRGELERARRDLAAAERRDAELMRLCVALARLASADTRAQVVDALREVVINVLGSEEFMLLERREGGARVPLAHMGLTDARVAALAAGDTAGLVAHVTLRVGAAEVGEVAIAGLLPHKGRLAGFDLQILDLLSTAGGSALSGATLRDARNAR
jgi:hypothetical protein